MIEPSFFDDFWTQLFKSESAMLLKNHDEILAAFHIGSTAIGIKNRLCVDVLLVCEKPPTYYEEYLGQFGYKRITEDHSGLVFFSERHRQARFKIYLYQSNDNEIERYLSIRDYLKANADLLQKFEGFDIHSQNYEVIKKKFFTEIAEDVYGWNTKKETIFDSKRILIQRWRPRDWINFHSLSSNPEVIGFIYTGYPFSKKDSEDFIATQINHMDRLGYCFFKLKVKGEHRIAGFCGIQPLGVSSNVEMGWWLLPDLQGHGYVTEVGKAVIEYIQHHFQISSIKAYCHINHHRSMAVMKRLGFKSLGVGVTDVFGMHPLSKPVHRFTLDFI